MKQSYALTRNVKIEGIVKNIQTTNNCMSMMGNYHCGKSYLLEQIMERLQNSEGNNVFFVRLSPVNYSSMDFCRNIIKSLRPTGIDSYDEECARQRDQGLENITEENCFTILGDYLKNIESSRDNLIFIDNVEFMNQVFLNQHKDETEEMQREQLVQCYIALEEIATAGTGRFIFCGRCFITELEPQYVDHSYISGKGTMITLGEMSKAEIKEFVDKIAEYHLDEEDLSNLYRYCGNNIELYNLFYIQKMINQDQTIQDIYEECISQISRFYEGYITWLKIKLKKNFFDEAFSRYYYLKELHHGYRYITKEIVTIMKKEGLIEACEIDTDGEQRYGYESIPFRMMNPMIHEALEIMWKRDKELIWPQMEKLEILCRNTIHEEFYHLIPKKNSFEYEKNGTYTNIVHPIYEYETILSRSDDQLQKKLKKGYQFMITNLRYEQDCSERVIDYLCFDTYALIFRIFRNKVIQANPMKCVRFDQYFRTVGGNIETDFTKLLKLRNSHAHVNVEYITEEQREEAEKICKKYIDLLERE